MRRLLFSRSPRSRPNNLVLLIDTYDTEAAARKVVALSKRLHAEGIAVSAVRLDSGDLIQLAKVVRRILDGGGLTDVKIFASGGIDEDELVRFREHGAPIDGFGIGTSLTTSFDLPALDCAYKLQEYDGLPRRKHSFGQSNMAWAKAGLAALWTGWPDVRRSPNSRG